MPKALCTMGFNAGSGIIHRVKRQPPENHSMQGAGALSRLPFMD